MKEKNEKEKNLCSKFESVTPGRLTNMALMHDMKTWCNYLDLNNYASRQNTKLLITYNPKTKKDSWKVNASEMMSIKFQI